MFEMFVCLIDWIVVVSEFLVKLDGCFRNIVGFFIKVLKNVEFFIKFLLWFGI